MQNKTGRSMGMAALVLSLTLGLAAKAQALNILTFDTGNPERNASIGALGFSVTQVGSSAVGGLEFSHYDVIYIAQSYEELLTSSLLGALGSRAGDLLAYIANGGGVVFGSPAVGGASGSGILSSPNPITAGVDLSTLSLSSLGSLPLFDAVAENTSGDAVILAGLLGEGRVVGWNPGEGPGLITDGSLTLVENSITWAAGDLPSVPEPGSYALFCLGAAGLLMLRRRKQA